MRWKCTESATSPPPGIRMWEAMNRPPNRDRAAGRGTPCRLGRCRSRRPRARARTRAALSGTSTVGPVGDEIERVVPFGAVNVRPAVRGGHPRHEGGRARHGRPATTRTAMPCPVSTYVAGSSAGEIVSMRSPTSVVKNSTIAARSVHATTVSIRDQPGASVPGTNAPGPRLGCTVDGHLDGVISVWRGRAGRRRGSRDRRARRPPTAP